MKTPTTTFRVFQDDKFVREQSFTLSVIKVGKSPSSHLRLEEDSISRMHAIIEVNEPHDAIVIDLGSMKGTFVNDVKVNKARLKDGDVLTFGAFKVHVVLGAAEALKPAVFERELLTSLVHEIRNALVPAHDQLAKVLPLPEAVLAHDQVVAVHSAIERVLDRTDVCVAKLHNLPEPASP